MMAQPWSSLRFRLIAAAAVGLVLGLAIVGVVLVKVYEDAARRAFDQRLQSLAHTLIATADIGASGELIIEGDLGEPLFERAYSGWYWQMSSAATPEHPEAVMRRSRSLFDFALQVPAKEGSEKGYEKGPQGERLRMSHMRVTLPGGASALRYRRRRKLWRRGGPGTGLSVDPPVRTRRDNGHHDRCRARTGALRLVADEPRPAGARGHSRWNVGLPSRATSPSRSHPS